MINSKKKYKKELSINLRITKVKVTNKKRQNFISEILLSTLPMEKYSKKRIKNII